MGGESSKVSSRGILLMLTFGLSKRHALLSRAAQDAVAESEASRRHNTQLQYQTIRTIPAAYWHI